MERDEAIVVVQRLMAGGYTDDEANGWLDRLERELVCPHISDLIFWPDEPLSAVDVVDRAIAYRPFEMGSG